MPKASIPVAMSMPLTDVGVPLRSRVGDAE
jgi:hypothetical protein